MSGRTEIRSGDVTANSNYDIKSCSTDVAWGAIIGGAFTAVAISLILIILGSALGLSAISPWSYGDSVTGFTIKTAIWLIIMQWIASGLAGYLTGRLRGRWEGVNADEAFFRDTAHGFLAWAVATVITATTLASAAGSVISGGVHATVAIASGSETGEGQGAAQSKGEDIDGLGNLTGYYIDSLFRPVAPDANVEAKDVRAEALRIMAMGIKNGSVPDADKTYLAQLVAARTGLGADEAARRVDDIISQINTAREKVKQSAEEARKTAMHVSIYMFLSLLVGAFIASSSAALGGRHRDEY